MFVTMFVRTGSCHYTPPVTTSPIHELDYLISFLERRKKKQILLEV